MKLVWYDEFNYEGRPDPEKWRLDIGGHGWGNGEAQYYTDSIDNAYVKDNKLTILAKKEDYETNNYTSAKLTTYGIKSWQYGRFEICAKLPKGKGTWPAIWMLPDSIQDNEPWPDCGEIDIMEHVGKNQDVVHFSLHTKDLNHIVGTQMTYFEEIKNVSEEFNLYAIDWTEDYIEFFVNDRSYAKYEKKSAVEAAGDINWPFDKPYYLILNLAIGGGWGGEVDDENLPQKMEVKYVKVYEM